MSDYPKSNSWDATKYDVYGTFVWRLGADLIELLDPRPDERILDVGCGTGHLTAKIAEAGAEMLGIDASQAMIERARSNYPLLRFEVLDALEMDLGGQFDAVFSNAALHWITKPEIAVSKIFDALKPGGRFVAEFGGEGNISTIIAAIHRACEQVGAPVTSDDSWYFPSVFEYSRLLEHAGFTVESAHLFDRPTPIGHEENALSIWLEVFSGRLLKGLPKSERNRALSIVEAELRPTMYRDETWVADYVRLRVMALEP